MLFLFYLRSIICLTIHILDYFGKTYVVLNHDKEFALKHPNGMVENNKQIMLDLFHIKQNLLDHKIHLTVENVCLTLKFTRFNEVVLALLPFLDVSNKEMIKEKLWVLRMGLIIEEDDEETIKHMFGQMNVGSGDVEMESDD